MGNMVLYLKLEIESNKKIIFRITDDTREPNLNLITKYITDELREAVSNDSEFILSVWDFKDYLYIGKGYRQFTGCIINNNVE